MVRKPINPLKPLKLELFIQSYMPGTELPLFKVGTRIDHPSVKGEQVTVLISTTRVFKYRSKRKIETTITNETASPSEMILLLKIVHKCSNCGEPKP